MSSSKLWPAWDLPAQQDYSRSTGGQGCKTGAQEKRACPLQIRIQLLIWVNRNSECFCGLVGLHRGLRALLARPHFCCTLINQASLEDT